MKNRIKMILIGSTIGLCFLLVGCGANKNALIIASEYVQESETSSQTAAPEETVEQPDTEPLEYEVYVYVCGAVNNPGVYILTGTPRICDAVDAAGGFGENAAQNYWNMAQMIVDGQMIYVPTVEEAQERDWNVWETENSAADSEASAKETGGKVNLNTASKEQLMTIPGVGEAKANLIISYREQNGAFLNIEDVMNISGIKNGLFEKMKEYITVE